MYYVGIDWADQKYDLVILDDAGQQVYQPLEIKKSDQGFNTLLAQLRTLSPCPDDFKIGIETPQNLLVDFLLQHHYPVFFIHPSSMKSFRKRYRRTNARDDV
jgi:transposase